MRIITSLVLLMLFVAGSAVAQQHVKEKVLTAEFSRLVASIPDTVKPNGSELERNARSLFVRGDTVAAKNFIAAKKRIQYLEAAYSRMVSMAIKCERENLEILRKQIEQHVKPQ